MFGTRNKAIINEIKSLEFDEILELRFDDIPNVKFEVRKMYEESNES